MYMPTIVNNTVLYICKLLRVYILQEKNLSQKYVSLNNILYHLIAFKFYKKMVCGLPWWCSG